MSKIILVIIIIWVIAAIIYKNVKKVSFPKAMISVILSFVKFIFSLIAEADGTDFSKAEKKAIETGDKEMLEKIKRAKEMNKVQKENVKTQIGNINSRIGSAQEKIENKDC